MIYDHQLLPLRRWAGLLIRNLRVLTSRNICSRLSRWWWWWWWCWWWISPVLTRWWWWRWQHWWRWRRQTRRERYSGKVIEAKTRNLLGTPMPLVIVITIIITIIYFLTSSSFQGIQGQYQSHSGPGPAPGWGSPSWGTGGPPAAPPPIRFQPWHAFWRQKIPNPQISTKIFPQHDSSPPLLGPTGPTTSTTPASGLSHDNFLPRENQDFHPWQPQLL